LLGKEVRYSGDDMDAFEVQMRKRAPSWSAFDIRMMFQGSQLIQLLMASVPKTPGHAG
jgi:hypothetical protein